MLEISTRQELLKAANEVRQQEALEKRNEAKLAASIRVGYLYHKRVQLQISF
jgi:hypothetical protein